MKYTLAFIVHNNFVLLLNCIKGPMTGRLNGVGGKIEAGEVPMDCIQREVLEEVGIYLPHLQFAGTARWQNDEQVTRGMYVYLATLPKDVNPLSLVAITREGNLDWYSLPDIFSGQLPIADGIVQFLPSMLKGEDLDHLFKYRNGELIDYIARPVREVKPWQSNSSKAT